MLKQDQSRKKYPSDLTDEQWAIVEPLIPPAKQSPRGGHPRKVDMREVLNTIFYLNRSGCQWDCGLSHIMADSRQIIWREPLRSLCKYSLRA